MLLSNTAQGRDRNSKLKRVQCIRISPKAAGTVTRTLAEALVAEMLRMWEVTIGTGAATKAASDNRAELRRPLMVVLGDTRAAADSIEANDSIVAWLSGVGGEG